MFSMISGVVTDRLNSGAIIIEVAAGLGMEVWVPDRRKPAVGDDVRLLLRTVHVELTGPNLYGFLEEAERTLFDRLRSLSGIGAVTALSVVSFVEPDRWVDVSVAEATTILADVPGLGSVRVKKIAAAIAGGT